MFLDGTAWVGSIDESEDGLATDHEILLSHMKYFDKDRISEAIDWMFPSGFDSNIASTQSILAVTNDSVDSWNAIVQNLNPNPIKCLKSHDIFADVDDPHGILQANLTPLIMNEINNPGTVPPHELNLKVT
jgi:hypothetical protein